MTGRGGQALGGTCCVREGSVPGEIAVALNPGQGGACRRLHAADERRIASPPLVLIEEDEKEWRRIMSAVVGRMRNFAQARKLTEPQLMQNLAGLGVPEVVGAGCLH